MNYMYIIIFLSKCWHEHIFFLPAYVFFFFVASNVLTYLLLHMHTIRWWRTQARSILERHLVIADKAYTMADLRSMANNDTLVLPAIRGYLNVRVKEDDKRKYINNLRIFIYEKKSTLCIYEYTQHTHTRKPTYTYTQKFSSNTRTKIYYMKLIFFLLEFSKDFFF